MNFAEAGRNPAVAVLLTLSGGFLDAFAYVGHGHVFANTMTGNVVLLGVGAAAADWAQAWRHVPPLVAFVMAVLCNHLLALAHSLGHRWAHNPTLACLLLEIAFLSAAGSGLLRIDDAWLIPGITFVATLQTLTFTHLESLSYSSVMTTGNLRRATQTLFDSLMPRYNPAPAHEPLPLHEARLLGMISLSFLVGAFGGAFFTRRFLDSALWVAVLLVCAALWQLIRVALRASRAAAAAPP